MQEIKDYPSLVDAVYKIVQGAGDQEPIDIASIASVLEISRDSRACVFGIADAMTELVNLGYCKGYEEFDGRYCCISPSPDAPNAVPSDYPIPHAINKLLPFRRRTLKFIHEKSVCYESGIAFYNQNVSIPIKGMLHELLPDGSDMEATLKELSASVQGLINSGFLAGVPFPNNSSVRPAALLPNEVDVYLRSKEIFPPEMYFRDPLYLAKIITAGELRLWVTFGGAVCLNSMSSPKAEVL
jgi:hypothetical protein